MIIVREELTIFQQGDDNGVKVLRKNIDSIPPILLLFNNLSHQTTNFFDFESTMDTQSINENFECLNTGGGNTKRPSQSITQEIETIQNLVELTDTGLEKATMEDWSMFMNALKIVKVDRMRDPLQGKKDHAKMYVPTLVRKAPGPGGMASVTMALPDSGNLLAHAAIDAKFN